MKKDGKREKLHARIAEDVAALKAMVPEGETIVHGYLQLIATGKLRAAREMLSLLNRVNDNMQRLENRAPGSRAMHHDELAYQSLGHAAARLVAAQKGSEAQR